MSCSKLYKHSSALFDTSIKTPLIVFKPSLHTKINELLAAQELLNDDDLKHKQAGADYKCGIPDILSESVTHNGLYVYECIDSDKTGFAIIGKASIIPSEKKALIVFGRRTFSNWCEYPVDGCGKWNEARFKAACATVFIDDEQYEKVMTDIMLAKTPADVQKATKGIANFDPALWDSKAVKAMYDSLLLTCTNKVFFDMMLSVAKIIYTDLGLKSLVGAVEFVESNVHDSNWGNGFTIRDFVDTIVSKEPGFDLLDAAKEGFAGKGGKNQLGKVLTAIMHTVCEIADYEEFKALVNAENLVVVRGEA